MKTPTPATVSDPSDLTHPSDVFTVAEVAQLLRVDDTTVRRWIKAGTLEAITLPHRGKHQAYRITRQKLETLLGGPLPSLPSC